MEEEHRQVLEREWPRQLYYSVQCTKVQEHTTVMDPKGFLARHVFLPPEMLCIVCRDFYTFRASPDIHQEMGLRKRAECRLGKVVYRVYHWIVRCRSNQKVLILYHLVLKGRWSQCLIVDVHAGSEVELYKNCELLLRHAICSENET